MRFNVHRIVDELEVNQKASKELRQPFIKHRHLWAKEIEHTLELFLEEATESTDENQPDAPRMPVLATFQARIQELKEEEAEIKELDGVMTEGWLRIDAEERNAALVKEVDALTYDLSHLGQSRDHALALKAARESEVSKLKKAESKLSQRLKKEEEVAAPPAAAPPPLLEQLSALIPGSSKPLPDLKNA